MAKCATCVFHEKDKRMENAWFLANYNEAKTMRLSKRMENARGTFGHVVNAWQLSIGCTHRVLYNIFM